MIFTGANYTVSNTATGRGTMSLAFTFGGVPDSMNFVFLRREFRKAVMLESDPVTTATPLLNGIVVQQQMPEGGFTNASLNSNMVILLTGHSACGTVGGIPKNRRRVAHRRQQRRPSLTYDENFCGAPHSVTDAAGTYSVAGNGRASIAVGGYALVAYLVKPNEVFLFVSDINVLFGAGEPQTAVSFTNTSLTGAYAGMATNPVAYEVDSFLRRVRGERRQHDRHRRCRRSEWAESRRGL